MPGKLTKDGWVAKKGLYRNAVRYLRHLGRNLSADGHPELKVEANELRHKLSVLLEAGEIPRARN